MGHPPHLHVFAEGQNLGYVSPVRLQVHLPNRAIEALRLLRVGEICIFEYLAGQGVAVSVQTARRETYHNIPDLYRLPGNDFPSLASSHAYPDHVEVPLTVQPGHLGRLAANEGYAERSASFRRPPDDLGHILGLEPPAGNIVEKKKGFSARGEDVVGAVVDDVHPQGAVTLERLRDEDLGADTVYSRSKHRLSIRRREGVQTGETAHNGKDLRPVRRLDGAAHHLCSLVTP